MAGFIEIIFIIAIVAIIFGARLMPQTGEAIGRWLHYRRVRRARRGATSQTDGDQSEQ